MRVCMCSCAGHVRQVVSALLLGGWWMNQAPQGATWLFVSHRRNFYIWEASTVLYSAAPSRSETCLQPVREWDTMQRAGQRPVRYQSIDSYSLEASTVLYSAAPSRSETCFQFVREWDTLPRAGQRPARHQSIDSYSWEASTVLYSAAPSRSETCLQAVREWK